MYTWTQIQLYSVLCDFCEPSSPKRMSTKVFYFVINSVIYYTRFHIEFQCIISSSIFPTIHSFKNYLLCIHTHSILFQKHSTNTILGISLLSQSTDQEVMNRYTEGRPANKGYSIKTPNSIEKLPLKIVGEPH